MIRKRLLHPLSWFCALSVVGGVVDLVDGPVVEGDPVLGGDDVDKNLLCLRSSNHLFSKRPSNQRSAPVLVLAKYSHLITMLMIMNG